MIQHFNPQDLARLQARAEMEGRQCVVGAVIMNGQQRAFVQKRAVNRRLFPGCWDLVGGHVEAGETLAEALRREIREETGWELSSIVRLIGSFDWEDEQGGKRRELDFLVQVAGDLEHPQLEWSKNSEFRWIGLAELELLQENRESEDTSIYDVVKKGLEDASSLWVE
jgi:8-oxo-dGTP pyrophosphatase MutT (NUDIX family)